ncbi:hypothetical protein Ancab_038792 [Ancistrocladus abbreviatus]
MDAMNTTSVGSSFHCGVGDGRESGVKYPRTCNDNVGLVLKGLLGSNEKGLYLSRVTDIFLDYTSSGKWQSCRPRGVDFMNDFPARMELEI